EAHLLMRPVAWWLLSALVVVSPRAARGDVGDFLGRTVVSVKLQSEQRDVVDSSLLEVVETHVGRPLSMIDVRESVTHLFSFGRFEDVRVHAGRAEGGVALLYDLVPIHPVDRIVFTGAHVDGVDAGRLRRAVVERYGASPPVGRTTDLARVVDDELRQRGYLHASVKPRAELRHGPDRATLVFEIEPGARTRIGRIDLSGRPGMAASDVLKRLNLVQGTPYERQQIDRRIERYV